MILRKFFKISARIKKKSLLGFLGDGAAGEGGRFSINTLVPGFQHGEGNFRGGFEDFTIDRLRDQAIGDSHEAEGIGDSHQPELPHG